MDNLFGYDDAAYNDSLTEANKAKATANSLSDNVSKARELSAGLSELGIFIDFNDPALLAVLESINDMPDNMLDMQRMILLSMMQNGKQIKLTWEVLTILYPQLANVSDERKAVIMTAFRYLGMDGSGSNSPLFNYARQFKTDYQNFQIAYSGAWCANFVNGIICSLYGDDIMPKHVPSSLDKIFGASNNGAMSPDNPNMEFKYGKYYLNYYNNAVSSGNTSAIKGVNPSWADNNYVPQAGDIIAFNGNYRGGYNSKQLFTGSKFTHTGFVLGTREINGVLYVDTIQRHGNTVETISYRADDPYICGYAKVNYEGAVKNKTEMNKVLSQGIDTSKSGATANKVAKQLNMSGADKIPDSSLTQSTSTDTQGSTGTTDTSQNNNNGYSGDTGYKYYGGGGGSHSGGGSTAVQTSSIPTTTPVTSPAIATTPVSSGSVVRNYYYNNAATSTSNTITTEVPVVDVVPELEPILEPVAEPILDPTYTEPEVEIDTHMEASPELTPATNNNKTNVVPIIGIGAAAVIAGIAAKKVYDKKQDIKEDNNKIDDSDDYYYDNNEMMDY